MTGARRVALATCAALPRLDDDDRLVVPALATLGVAAEPAVWDDPAVDWSAYDLVVVRSTWDYQDQREAFVGWAASVPRLANPAPVLAWNTDKRYLGELAEAGLPTVPTAFVSPGEAFTPPDAPELVVKPTVSAGSRDTARHAASALDAVREHVAELHGAGRTVMVQPYLEAVDTAGETALLYLGGSYSHAIRKGPLLRPGAPPTDGLFAPEEIRPREPAPEERALGDRVVAAVEKHWGRLLYVRVDLIRDPEGAPTVIEVELTEPSLFLAHGAEAPERFAQAIAAIM